jgi:hypothetical protein
MTFSVEYLISSGDIKYTLEPALDPKIYNREGFGLLFFAEWFDITNKIVDITKNPPIIIDKTTT